MYHSCADLRRPRSEPSNYYSSECQRDLPQAKKHKPNPELFQTRPDKAMSVPLSLEQQQLHRLSSSPKSTDKGLSGGASGGGAKWSSRESFSSGASGRKSAGAGGSSLGKERLASRLRQREQLGMLVMAEREMVDTELLSYREDLVNQDCLTQMDDLQVRAHPSAHPNWPVHTVSLPFIGFASLISTRILPQRDS